MEEPRKPRCVIVKASMLRKENRWDPAHFIGDTIDVDRVIHNSKQAIKAAKTRIANAKKAKKTALDRAASLHASGDVVPFPESP